MKYFDYKCFNIPFVKLFPQRHCLITPLAGFPYKKCSLNVAIAQAFGIVYSNSMTGLGCRNI